MELEKAWWNEVQEIVTGSRKLSDAYFFDLLQHEVCNNGVWKLNVTLFSFCQSSLKSFELLCCLKSVELNHSDLFSTAETLQYV